MDSKYYEGFAEKIPDNFFLSTINFDANILGPSLIGSIWFVFPQTQLTTQKKKIDPP